MAPQVSSTEFYAYLVSQNLVSKEQLSECLKIQQELRSMGLSDRSLLSILLDKQYLTKEQISELKNESLDFDFTPKPKLPEIPGYTVKRKLGEGGMGAVYLARQISMDRYVAIKTLPKSLAENKDFVIRFQREARASAALNHRNIVAGIDVGEANGIHYFVMEYIKGKTVDTLLNSGPITEKKALKIVAAVASALEHAHTEAGIVHRDVKPDNIMITYSGEIKLLDFGLCKQVNNSKEGNLTQENSTFGTPYYVSPEQASGEKVDIRSDLYSLGATLFHLATGEPPFTGSNSLMIMTKHVNEPLPDPKEKNPELSGKCANLIFRMMEKDKNKRFQTPRELLDSIERVKQGLSLPNTQELDALDDNSPTQLVPTLSAGRIGSGTFSALHGKKRKKHSSFFRLGVALVLFIGAAFLFKILTNSPQNLANKGNTENQEIGSSQKNKGNPDSEAKKAEEKGDAEEKEASSSTSRYSLAESKLEEIKKKIIPEFEFEQVSEQLALFEYINSWVKKFPKSEHLFVEQAKTILDRIEVLGDVELKKRQEFSQKLLTKNDIKAALDLWDHFPPQLELATAYTQAKQIRKQIFLNYQDRFEKEYDEYENLLANHKYDEAQSLHKKIISFCLKEDLNRVQKLKASFAEKKEAYFKEKIQQERKEYQEYSQQEIWPQFKSLKDSDYQDAWQKLIQCEEKYPHSQEEIQQALKIVMFLINGRKRLVEFFKEKKKIRLDKKWIYPAKTPLEELTLKQIVFLFLLITKKKEVANFENVFLEQAVFCYFQKDYRNSWAGLQQVENYTEKLPTLASKIEKEGKLSWEKEAKLLFAKAEILLAKNSRSKQKSGRKLLQQLLEEYQKTAFVQSHLTNIEEALAGKRKKVIDNKGVTALNALEKHLHGKVSQLTPTLFRIEYEFKSKDELSDFEATNIDITQPGRLVSDDFSLHPQGGLYGHNYSILLWKPKLEGDVSFEFTCYPTSTKNLGCVIHRNSLWSGTYAFVGFSMYPEFVPWANGDTTLFYSNGISLQSRPDKINATGDPFEKISNKLSLTEFPYEEQLLYLRFKSRLNHLEFYVDKTPFHAKSRPLLSGRSPSSSSNSGNIGLICQQGAIITKLIIIASFEKIWLQSLLIPK